MQMAGTRRTWLHLARPDGIERVRVGPLSLGGLHALISARLGRSFPAADDGANRRNLRRKPVFRTRVGPRDRCGSSIAQAGLPGSLSELMRLRIGRLDRDARKLLLAAASVANPTVELLAQVTGVPVEIAW